MPRMGRRRLHDLGLPPLMFQRTNARGVTRYYYGRAGVALGSDFRAALRQYAELHAGEVEPGTFPDAVAAYRRDVLPTKAPKTQAEYDRQLVTLEAVFRDFRVEQITPGDVSDFMIERSKRTVDARGRPQGGPIVATREKALLSAVINFARSTHLSDAPNPCAGIKGTKAHRDRYVSDAELRAAIGKVDDVLAGFLELCYLTGQRPGDVVKIRRADVQDGTLHVAQGKTGAKVRIAVVGPLQTLLARLVNTRGRFAQSTADGNCAPRPLGSARVADPADVGGSGGVTGRRDDRISSMYLIRDERGQPFTLAALRKRFKRRGFDWQIRDLRAKAASDSATALDAQRLLGHAHATTTDGYIRQRAGTKARPIMRKVSK
jgi:integrase